MNEHALVIFFKDMENLDRYFKNFKGVKGAIRISKEAVLMEQWKIYQETIKSRGI